MVNGINLRKAIISGANCICSQKSHIDDLNIFPVPDGDTGTNMSMTMTSAKTALEKAEETSVSKIASIAASALLRGARGNSGVILSLLFRGFSKGLDGLEEASAKDMVAALGIGVNDAYKAVMKPTEGTILTVARMAFESGTAAAELENDIISVWMSVCNAAEEALAMTPELLPVLKKAGVVDAGGKGLCVIFNGMLSVFRDDVVIEYQEPQNTQNNEDEFRSAAAKFDEDITFTYCTEYIVKRDSSVESDPQILREYLQTIGDCVVVVDDDEIIKVHVHTDNPGTALQKALEFGSLLTVKVENMREQHKAAGESEPKAEPKQENKIQTFEFKEPTDEIGFVAVASGEGLTNLFKELGVNNVVSGGQSMNPSTEEIAAAILGTPAKTVFVMPNNKNIILAAEQTVPLISDRTVIILPTKTIPQGLSAMLTYDPDLSEESNRSLMLDAAEAVSTGQVTFAARDSEFGLSKIKEGQIIALENGKLTLTEANPVKAVYKLAKNMIKRETAFVTLIYGDGVSESEAQEAFEMIKSKAGSHAAVTLINGGQPIYYFLLSVE
ncbi:MAG: DAK2 domain-containing protein [Bacillota bacterium]|nr:DAK2 domain-containing protein [Bacillota bacterium]